MGDNLVIWIPKDQQERLKKLRVSLWLLQLNHSKT